MGNKIQKIYVGSNKVRPPRWMYTPTSNTLVYLPLIDGLTDYGNLGRSWTQSRGTFSDGVFDASSDSGYIYSGPTTYSTYSSYTMMCWVNYIGGIIFNFNNYGDGNNGNVSILQNKVERYNGSSKNITFTAKPTGERHHYAIVGNSGILYIDGAQVGTNTTTVNMKPRLIGVNCQRTDGTSCQKAKYSDFILENKTWTAAEVSNYYASSRGNYGV